MEYELIKDTLSAKRENTDSNQSVKNILVLAY